MNKSKLRQKNNKQKLKDENLFINLFKHKTNKLSYKMTSNFLENLSKLIELKNSEKLDIWYNPILVIVGGGDGEG